MGPSPQSFGPLLVSVGDRRICLRSVQPGDRSRIAEGLRRLSPTTAYHRFFTPTVSLSERQLRYLTEVDGEDHVAIGAVDCGPPEEPGMGIARYIRDTEAPDVAEAAVLVVDAYQREGIGTLLMTALHQHAHQHGIRHFQGYVLGDNVAFLQFLRRFGAVTRRTDRGVLDVDMPVYASPEDLPGEAQTPSVRRAWTLLQEASRGDCSMS